MARSLRLRAKTIDDGFHFIDETLDKSCSGLTTCHSHPLASPQREEFRAPLFGGCLSKRPRQHVLIWERKDRVRRRCSIDFLHEAVDDTPSGTTGEGACQASLILMCPENGLLV